MALKHGGKTYPLSYGASLKYEAANKAPIVNLTTHRIGEDFKTVEVPFSAAAEASNLLADLKRAHRLIAYIAEHGYPAQGGEQDCNRSCFEDLAPKLATTITKAGGARPLWLVNVKFKKGKGWAVYHCGARISTYFVRGQDALNHGIEQGWQTGYRNLTYNEGGYLNGVRAEAN